MNPLKSNPRSLRGQGFSLIELLAAMTVLAILALLIFQVTTATSNTTRISNRAVDAAAQARIVFDRMSTDLSAVVKRTDTDFRAGNSGNLLDFLSGVTGADPKNPPASFKNRGYSRVVYRMDHPTENQGKLCLVRAAKALSWTDSGFFGLKNNGYPVVPGDTGYPTTLNLAATDYDVLGAGVIVAVIGYQLYPDDEPVYFSGDSAPSIANARGQIVYKAPMRGPVTAPVTPDNSYIDLSRVSAVVVGLVVLDLESVPLLDVSNTDLLATAFTTTPPDGQMPVAKWMADTANLTNLPAVPIQAKQAIRLYQRFFPITPFGSR